MAKRLLDKRETASRIARHPESLMRMVREGRFPPPVEPPGNNHKHWLESEIDLWIEAAVRERDERLAKEAGPK